MAGYRKLGRTSSQRKALLRNQVTNLLYHGSKTVDVAAFVLDDLAPKYAERNGNGGYTRIVKIGQRKGDAAMQVLIELV